VTVASVPQTEGVATKKTAAKPNKKLIVHPKPTTTVVKQLEDVPLVVDFRWRSS
jgi:hypothetical protein